MVDVIYEDYIDDRIDYEIGFLPHYVDLNTELSHEVSVRSSSKVKFISPRQHPRKVAQDISKCEVLYSSSLHGLIFADSLGKPSVWMKSHNKIVGNDFKFLDHQTVTGVERKALEINTYAEIVSSMHFAKEADHKILSSNKSNLLLAFESFFRDE